MSYLDEYRHMVDTGELEDRTDHEDLVQFFRDGFRRLGIPMPEEAPEDVEDAENDCYS